MCYVYAYKIRERQNGGRHGISVREGKTRDAMPNQCTRTGEYSANAVKGSIRVTVSR